MFTWEFILTNSTMNNKSIVVLTKFGKFVTIIITDRVFRCARKLNVYITMYSTTFKSFSCFFNPRYYDLLNNYKLSHCHVVYPHEHLNHQCVKDAHIQYHVRDLTILVLFQDNNLWMHILLYLFFFSFSRINNDLASENQYNKG